MFRNAKFILPAALLLIILSYFFIDRPLSAWIATFPSWVAKGTKLFAESYTPGVFLVAWPLIFYFYTFILRKSTFRRELLFIAIAIPATLLAVYILKFAVGRGRPELWLYKDIYTFRPLTFSGKWQSFPSGQSGTISALMAALSCFRPKLTWLFVLVAFVFSFMRVLALDHYFSDIFTSIVIAFYLVRGLFMPVQRSSAWKNF